MKGNRARVAAWVAFVALTLGIIPAAQHAGVAHAQNLGQRNVAGLVVDDNSAVVQGATVFLKNQKTKSIRSYTSASNGSFRFAQVNMTDDYDLWAEKDGKKSTTKTVSSWDARKDFETELKLK
ncbi:MAG: carboxypeptidase-like regulatory domain-containing protein [Terracidiphilus sp.]